jgi:hypothetical protein
MDYVDFQIEVGAGQGGEYPIHVRSEFGETDGTFRLPFDTLALQNRLQSLQIALLRSATASRRVASPEEEVVQQFGRELFESLLKEGPIRGRFEATRDGAWQRDAGMRVTLRIVPPEIAALPWEYLYDPERGDFLALSITTPLVRNIPLARPMRPLTVQMPLRVLGMIAASADLPNLDAAKERQRLDIAMKPLVDRGLVEFEWLPSGTWRDLQQWLLKGPWHVFHFIGHGGFDRIQGEGFVYLTDENGRASRMPATGLGRLLGDHDPLRLAVLNACEGARADDVDVFSSTAAVLVQRGTPGVVAMQYEITDRAAIEFSRSFYGAVVEGMPIDAALAVARKSISLEIPGTLEWGTPALFLRASNGVLFDLAPSKRPRTVKPAATREPSRPSPESPPPPADLPADLPTFLPAPPLAPLLAAEPVADAPSTPSPTTAPSAAVAPVTLPAPVPTTVPSLAAIFGPALASFLRQALSTAGGGFVATLVGAVVVGLAGLWLGVGAVYLRATSEGGGTDWEKAAFIAGGLGLWIGAAAGAYLGPRLRHHPSAGRTAIIFSLIVLVASLLDKSGYDPISIPGVDGTRDVVTLMFLSVIAVAVPALLARRLALWRS